MLYSGNGTPHKLMKLLAEPVRAQPIFGNLYRIFHIPLVADSLAHLKCSGLLVIHNTLRLKPSGSKGLALIPRLGARPRAAFCGM